MKHPLIFLLLLSLFAASCTQSDTPEAEVGKGYLLLTGIDVQAPAASPSAHTRALCPDLSIDICAAGSDEVIVQIPAGSTGYSLPLDAGKYLLKAYSANYATRYEGNDPGEAKYYTELPFEIETDRICRLEVNVPMTNFAVTLSLPEGYDKWFEASSFTISYDARTLTLSPHKTAYLDPMVDTPLSYTLTLTNHDGEVFSREGAIEAPAKGTCYHISYELPNLAYFIP